MCAEVGCYFVSLLGCFPNGDTYYIISNEESD